MALAANYGSGNTTYADLCGKEPFDYIKLFEDLRDKKVVYKDQTKLDMVHFMYNSDTSPSANIPRFTMRKMDGTIKDKHTLYIELNIRAAFLNGNFQNGLELLESLAKYMKANEIKEIVKYYEEKSKGKGRGESGSQLKGNGFGLL